MSEEIDAGSNPAGEAIAPVVTQAEVPAAPAAPAVDEKPPSAREALERAFAKTEPKTETEEVKPEPKADHPTDPARYADGTFKTTKPPEQKTEVKPAEAKPAEKPAEIKPEKAVQGAPERFVKAAKDAWAQTPDVVRAEIERAIAELSSGIEKYKPAAEAYTALKPFDDMAKQAGTTLPAALQNYVSIERTFAQNPLAGFIQICRNQNLDPVKIGASLAGLQPQQIAQLQQQQATPQQQPQTSAEIERIEGLVLQMQIQQFKSQPEHKYFDEVREDMQKMLSTGFANDLHDAYAKAVRLNPDVAAKIEAERAPPPTITTPQPDPAQTRQKAALSITGSPNPGSNPAASKPAGSARDALQSAFAQVGL